MKFASQLTLKLLVVGAFLLPHIAIGGDKAKCAEWYARITERIEDLSYPPYLRSSRLLEDEDIKYHLGAQTARNFSRAWQLVTARGFVRNDSSLRTMIEVGDPQVPFLKDIGFVFDFSRGHRVPAMSTLSPRLDKLLSESALRDDLTEAQTLTPARMFQIVENGQRRYIPVKLTSDPPPGSKPVYDAPRGLDFLKFIADGYYPMAEIMRNGETQMTFAFHDLGHFGSFVRHPKYMAALRELAKTRIANGTYDDSVINLVFENLALGRPESRDVLQKALSPLGVHLSLDQAPASVHAIQEKLLKLESHSIAQLTDNLYSKRFEFVAEYGGLQSDGLSKINRLDATSGLQSNPRGFIEKAKKAATIEEKTHWLSRFVSAMDHTMRTSPEEWAHEVGARDVKPSWFENYFCKSGCLLESDSYFQIFCGSKL